MQEAADGNRTTAWVKEGLAAGGERPKSEERDGQEETERHGERDRQTTEKQTEAEGNKERGRKTEGKVDPDRREKSCLNKGNQSGQMG